MCRLHLSAPKYVSHTCQIIKSLNLALNSNKNSQIPFFVRMNSLNSETIRDRLLKFADNTSNNCPQLLPILKLDHALSTAVNQEKTHFKDYFKA